MAFGLLGMYISVPKLDSKYLSQLSLEVVANFFQLPLDQEEEISKGIYLSKPGGPLRQLAEMIQQVFNQTGQILLEFNKNSLGEFFLEICQQKHSMKALQVIDCLVQKLPTFQDITILDDKPIYFLKNVQLLVGNLSCCFPEKFDFQDINELAICSDSCVLYTMGILELENVDEKSEFSQRKSICQLRASTILACDQIIQQSNGRIKNHFELQMYLLRIGKEEEFYHQILQKRYNEIITKQTYFY
jgi:hypothetical protein